jgi:cold shock CspA family protein
MHEGIVIFFDRKGYGFVRPNDGSEDIFFHVSELPGKPGSRAIDAGTAVQYEIGISRGKRAARKISIVTEVAQ